MGSYRSVPIFILTLCLVLWCVELAVASADSPADGGPPTVEGQVIRLDADSVEILFYQTAVSSVAFDFQHPSATSDTITLRGEELVLKGKILEVTPETILVRFPKEALEQVVVVYPSSTGPVPSSRIQAIQEPAKPSAGKPQVPLVQHSGDETLSIQPILPEPEPTMEAALKPHPGDETPSAPSVLQKLMSSRSATLEQQIEAAVDARLYGEVTGAVVWGGRPLEGCEVKLKPIAKDWNLLDVFKRFKGHDEEPDVPQETLTTSTDAKGRFVFSRVPPGRYDLYWRTPGSISWIRRLSAEPSVTVTPAMTVTYPLIEAHVRTIN